MKQNTNSTDQTLSSIDNLPLRLQKELQNVGDLVKQYQEGEGETLYPISVNISRPRPPTSHSLILKCFFRKLTTKTFDPRPILDWEIEISLHIPTLFPHESPWIACHQGEQQLPSNLLRNGRLFIPWIHEGWPIEYSLADFISDLASTFRTTTTSSSSSSPATIVTTTTTPATSPSSFTMQHPTAPFENLLHSNIVYAVPILDVLPMSSLTPQQQPTTNLNHEYPMKHQISVKCKRGNEIRRFLVDHDVKFQQLADQIRKILVLNNSESFQMAYKDRDSDTCLISCDEELTEAIHHLPSPKTLFLGIKVFPPKNSNLNNSSSVQLLPITPFDDIVANQKLSHESSIRQIPFTDIVLGECIGTGSSCQVHKGTWRGTEVAVKRLNLHDNMLKDYDQEVRMMNILGAHPSIVLLLAVCNQPLCLVFEYLPCNLFELIHGKEPNKPGCTTTTTSLVFPSDWPRRIQMMLDIASGLQFLHSFHIIHRNLLVSDSYRIKLSDFGLARESATNNLMTSCCGTFQWMAPEVISSQKYSISADIYSTPFQNLSPMQVAMSVVSKHARPTIPTNIPGPLAQIITRSWHVDPDKRPTCETITQHLQKCLHLSKTTSQHNKQTT